MKKYLIGDGFCVSVEEWNRASEDERPELYPPIDILYHDRVCGNMAVREAGLRGTFVRIKDKEMTK